MQSQNQDNKPELPTEAEVDKSINEFLNEVDKLLLGSPIQDAASMVFMRGVFGDKDGSKTKTVMGLRKSEKNDGNPTDIFLLMLSFICKKLGFKEDAVRAFIVGQIKESNPEAVSVDAALDELLSPLFPTK